MFNEILHTLRTGRGLTLEEVAQEVGTSKSHIWSLENTPNTKPSAQLVYRLAMLFGTTVEHLLGTPPDDSDIVFMQEYALLDKNLKKKLYEIMKSLKQCDQIQA